MPEVTQKTRESEYSSAKMIEDGMRYEQLDQQMKEAFNTFASLQKEAEEVLTRLRQGNSMLGGRLGVREPAGHDRQRLSATESQRRLNIRIGKALSRMRSLSKEEARQKVKTELGSILTPASLEHLEGRLEALYPPSAN